MRLQGHAIECRINAENPAKKFLPSPGTITRLRVPAGPGVRWDGGYEEGDTVSQYYDNLIGKLVVWAPDRDRAIARTKRALEEFEIGGVKTTIPAHIALVSHPDFAAVRHSTKWVEDELDAALFADVAAPAPAPAADGEEKPALVERTLPVEVDGKRFVVKVWVDETAAVAPAAATRARPRAAARSSSAGGVGGGTVVAPMQGTIVKVMVAVGDAVESGQALLVLEAMKMENHINAEKSGTVKELRVTTGDTVGTGDVLVIIE
jgi:acetyl-CoA/propionyl-CoA carboxylase biotin carboxyl carrier protein